MKKAGSIFIALNLLGLGINFVLQAGFGCDAITMLNDGIALFLNTNYTIAGVIYNTILIIISLFMARNLLGWGSVIYAYGTGILIDVYQSILFSLQIADASVEVRIIALVVGQGMICFAFAMLIALDLGRSSLDAILSSLTKKLSISYRFLKTICDLLFVILAYLFGSQFGIGTILCMLTGGFTIDFFCQQLMKYKAKYKRSL